MKKKFKAKNLKKYKEEILKKIDNLFDEYEFFWVGKKKMMDVTKKYRPKWKNKSPWVGVLLPKSKEVWILSSLPNDEKVRVIRHEIVELMGEELFGLKRSDFDTVESNINDYVYYCVHSKINETVKKLFNKRKEE